LPKNFIKIFFFVVFNLYFTLDKHLFCLETITSIFSGLDTFEAHIIYYLVQLYQFV